MKPSERIQQLVDAVVEVRFFNAKKEQNAEFMMTIMGASDVDLKESIRNNPMTWIAAITLYLDETHEGRS
jgi:hypothetical protein